MRYDKDKTLTWALSVAVAGVLAIAAGVVSYADRLGVDLSALSSFGLVFSMAALVASALGFVFFDGGRLAAKALLSISFGLFLFLPAMYYSLQPGLGLYEIQALLAAILSFISILLVCPRGLAPQLAENYAELVSQGPGHREALFLFVVLLLSFLFLVLLEPLTIFWRGASAGAIIGLFALALSNWSERNRVASILLGVSSIGFFVLWYFVFFSGFSRINVAALLFSFLLVFLLARPSRVMKLLVVGALPFGLAWGAMQRDGATTVREAWAGEGLGSVFSPFRDYAQTLEHSGMFGFFNWYHWSEQIVASLLFWIPREWWPTKPEGFGALLTAELRPHLLASGHSSASSILGEMAAYFGLFGPLFVAAIVVIIVGLVNWITGGLSRKLGPVIGLSVGVYATAQMLSLVWMGVFTFSVRVGSVLLGILVIAALVKWWRPRRLSVGGDPV